MVAEEPSRVKSRSPASTTPMPATAVQPAHQPGLWRKALVDARALARDAALVVGAELVAFAAVELIREDAGSAVRATPTVQASLGEASSQNFMPSPQPASSSDVSTSSAQL
jgi:hypothetical protein